MASDKNLFAKAADFNRMLDRINAPRERRTMGVAPRELLEHVEWVIENFDAGDNDMIVVLRNALEAKDYAKAAAYLRELEVRLAGCHIILISRTEYGREIVW